MARIINDSARDFPLPTGHVVPARGQLVTTNDVLRSADNARLLGGMALSGGLGVEYDPDPPPDAPPDAPGAPEIQHDTQPAAGKKKG